MSYFICFLVSLSLTACSFSQTVSKDSTNTPLSAETKAANTSNTSTSPLIAETLLQDIKEKYAETASYSFSEQVHVLERNETLVVDLGFPITSDHNTYDMFQFFLDPQLTIPLWRPAPSQYYEGHDKVKIKPSTYPLFRTEFEGEARRENANWGNAGTLYLAKYYDKQGNVTDEPQEVSIVKIKTELPTPNVTLTTDSKGFATLKWQRVPGAEIYHIYSITLTGDQLTGDEILYHHGSTTKTTYSDFSVYLYDTSYITGVTTNNILSINDDFVYTPDDALTDGYVVIAEGPKGKSEMSTIIKPNDYAYMLPNLQDYDVSSDEITADEELNLPLYFPVQMCDESTVLYPIEYDLNSVQKFKGDHATTQVEGKGLAQRMTIIGRPKGTPFEEVFYFYYFPETETVEEALAAFVERQKNTSAKGSGLNKQIDIQIVSEGNENSTSNENTISINDNLPVTATNPVSEYLAYNMISGVTSIPLDAFPITSDTNYFCDALKEALYQNPLILGVDSFNFNPYSNSLIVTYSLDQQEQEKRQQQVMDKAKEIVSNIITPNMTDLEKEEAINTYLCENITYDTAALESAEKNDYQYADPEFDDSFTVYGALINNVCVCKGYAEAFKLLADLAGLDALVVTGQLESVGHAWNKVKIDGQWLTIDVTNNDNEFIPNAIFNLSDEIASLMIVENKDYILDANYKNYTSDSTQSEYYHLKDRFFEQSEVGDILLSALNSSENEILLRTNYELSEDTFYDMLLDATESSQINEPFEYRYWFGVIYIKK